MTGRLQPPPVTRRGIPIEHLWVLVVLLGVFVMTNLRPIPPYDSWWHLKAGEIIVGMHLIPAVDEFSFTMAGKSYDNYAQFWLTESLMYLLYRLGGLQLLIFVHSLAVTLAYTLVFAACRSVAVWRPSLAGLLFAVGLGFPNWNLRPQGFVLPLAAAFLWCILQDLSGRSQRAVLAIPLIMLLWVNSHGSWVVGGLLLVIYLAARLARAVRTLSAAREMRFPITVAMLAFLAVLINPLGPRILVYVMTMAGDPVSQATGTEWAPAILGQPAGAMFLTGLLLCSLILMLSQRRPSVFEVFAYLAFGLLAFKMIRAILWFGIVMAPAIAIHVGSEADRGATRRETLPSVARVAPTRTRHRVNAAILALLLLSIPLSTPWLKGMLPLPAGYRGLVSDDTPVDAVEFMLANELPPNVFSEQGFGSYLIWAASSQYRVFVDPRLELYTLELFQEYHAVSAANVGWEQILARRDVGTLLLSPKQQPELIRAVAQSSAWRQLYADDKAVVFRREG